MINEENACNAVWGTLKNPILTITLAGIIEIAYEPNEVSFMSLLGNKIFGLHGKDISKIITPNMPKVGTSLYKMGKKLIIMPLGKKEKDWITFHNTYPISYTPKPQKLIFKFMGRG